MPEEFPEKVYVIDTEKPYRYKFPEWGAKDSAMNPKEAVCLQLAKNYLNPILPPGALDPIAPYLKEAEIILDQQQTDVRMKNNETLVLSGLIDRTLSMQVSKFPFLGDLPILGVFFRNTAEIDSNRELAVFITPTVMNSSNNINQSYIQRSDKLIDAYKSRNNILD